MTTEMKLYQSEDLQVKLDVLVENETVWLNQAQIGALFGVQKSAISKHLKHIFDSGELRQEAVVSILETTAADGKRYSTKFYNLDAVLSVGYRVNSISATHFRIWANHVLKEYILHGGSINQRIEKVEHRMLINELGLQSVNQKIDHLVQTALPPKQGIFFDGQIFDAYQFVSDLIRGAKKSIVLIDNYADDSVLTQLTKRTEGVTATVCVSRLTNAFRLDVDRHNMQYPPVRIQVLSSVHDRFLLLDDSVLYTFGASFKDLGKKLFCFTLIESADVVEVVRRLGAGEL